MRAGVEGTASGSRPEVASAVLERAILPQERTLATEIVVMQLLDRIAEVADGASAARLMQWLEDISARHPELGCLSVLLSATWRQVLENGALEGRIADKTMLMALGETIDAAARKPRPLSIARDEPFDEIDACLADLIVRLFEHDPITAEHSKAVSSWCARLARKLGLSPADTLLVKRGGLAHDVGKIGTPETILLAPRSLNDDEWAVMRRHTIDGAEIVADLPLLAELLPAIRSHHERLDGAGYPDGLRGDDIPLSARIVAVADCFNAMIGRRPYRPPMAPSRALELLDKAAGTHLDPEIVAAMRAIVTG
ncbi:MAG TPA: HD-GYP domain-containing protein [Candidatus Baltobacteraceae bacterium]|jgi:putative nucleotidyltransferase with HDIG domain